MTATRKEYSKMTQIIDGQLEIDAERGVIYFHSAETGQTVLRISRLPHPVPIAGESTLLDITHMYGVSWDSRKTCQERAEKQAQVKMEGG
jgi:hypothetical protein